METLAVGSYYQGLKSNQVFNKKKGTINTHLIISLDFEVSQSLKILSKSLLHISLLNHIPSMHHLGQISEEQNYMSPVRLSKWALGIML